MPTPSKRHLNWTGTVWTPSTGSAVTITGVTGIDIDPGGNVIKFSGDGDRFMTTIVSDMIDNSVTVTSGDATAIRSIQPGSRGTFASTHLDAKNLAVTGGGAIAYTLSQAVVVNNPTGGAHRQFGSHRLVLCAESTDGITNPLVSAAV